MDIFSFSSVVVLFKNFSLMATVHHWTLSIMMLKIGPNLTYSDL